MSEVSLLRCAWVGDRPGDDPMVRYHNEEWGVPEHNDSRLFELLTLEGAQAGLNWDMILKRRGGYRRAFHGFDIARIAAYDEEDTERLLQDAGIIRNRAKVAAAIGNARAALELQGEFGSLDAYVWRFVDGKPLVSRPRMLAEVPAQTEESRRMSKELQQRGFRFVGPTICYAFMQAAGLVDDHMAGCFRAAGGEAASLA